MADHEGREALASITHNGVTLYFLTSDELKAHDAEVAAAARVEYRDELQRRSFLGGNQRVVTLVDVVAVERRARADEGDPR